MCKWGSERAGCGAELAAAAPMRAGIRTGLRRSWRSLGRGNERFADIERRVQVGIDRFAGLISHHDHVPPALK